MNQKGQSLVEALVALGAAVVIVAAITMATITSVKNSDYSKVENLATNYAQQGMELIKQRNELSWSDLSATISASTRWCISQGSTDFLLPAVPTSCGVNIQNSYANFVRQVDFYRNNSSDCNGDTLAEVTVKWSDGKCSGATDYCHHVKLDSCVGNVYSAP